MNDTNKQIKLTDVTFGYGEIPVLKKFSLTVNKGECVVLSGDNGCGKSTVLQIISGLLFPVGGEYLFDGQKVDEKSMKKQTFAKNLHRKIGYVFQNTDAQLFCATAYDEIAFGPRQMELDEKEIDLRVHQLAELLNISHLLDRPPYHLSGGEKKRLAIAAVLSTAPDVLMLDEPLAFLDRKSALWLTEFLSRMKAAGKTILLVTHNDALTSALADRVIEI